jgi:hypothetical protein
LRGSRVLSVGISSAIATCFAVLAGLSISVAVVPARRFHILSIIISGVSIVFAYIAFRAAAASRTNKETLLASLRGGVVGALLSVVLIVGLLLMFGDETRAALAHALARPTSVFTALRLLVTSAALGFGTGFVVGSRQPEMKRRMNTADHSSGQSG